MALEWSGNESVLESILKWTEAEIGKSSTADVKVKSSQKSVLKLSRQSCILKRYLSQQKEHVKPKMEEGATKRKQEEQKEEEEQRTQQENEKRKRKLAKKRTEREIVIHSSSSEDDHHQNDTDEDWLEDTNLHSKRKRALSPSKPAKSFKRSTLGLNRSNSSSRDDYVVPCGFCKPEVVYLNPRYIKCHVLKTHGVETEGACWICRTLCLTANEFRSHWQECKKKASLKRCEVDPTKLCKPGPKKNDRESRIDGSDPEWQVAEPSCKTSRIRLSKKKTSL